MAPHRSFHRCWLQEASASRLSNRTWLHLLFCKGVLISGAEHQCHYRWTWKRLDRMHSIPGCTHRICESIVCSLEWSWDFILNCSGIYLTRQRSDSLLFAVVPECRVSHPPTFLTLYWVPAFLPSRTSLSHYFLCVSGSWYMYITSSTQILCCSLTYLKYWKSKDAIIEYFPSL